MDTSTFLQPCTISPKKTKKQRAHSLQVGIQSQNVREWLGCTSTSSARYLASITILSFGDWIPRDYAFFLVTAWPATFFVGALLAPWICKRKQTNDEGTVGCWWN